MASAALADVYVGVEYGAASNKTETTFSTSSLESGKIDNDYSDVKLKVGLGEDGGVKFQATLSMIEFDKATFDDTNKEYVEVGFDLIKEFEVTPQFYPFIKGGMGVGAMDVEGYNESKMYAVSLNLGAGVSYKAVEHVYLVAGLDYVYRKYQDIEYTRTTYYSGSYFSYFSSSTYTRETSDSGIKPYIGVNFQF